MKVFLTEAVIARTETTIAFMKAVKVYTEATTAHAEGTIAYTEAITVHIEFVVAHIAATKPTHRLQQLTRNLQYPLN